MKYTIINYDNTDVYNIFLQVLAIVNAENSLDLCGSTLKQLRYELASLNSDEIGKIKIVAFSSIRVLGELAVWLEKATHDADVSDLQTKVKYSLDLLNNILWDLKIQMEFENIDIESLADTIIVDDSDETQSLADNVILDGTEDWSSDE